MPSWTKLKLKIGRRSDRHSSALPQHQHIVFVDKESAPSETTSPAPILLSPDSAFQPSPQTEHTLSQPSSQVSEETTAPRIPAAGENGTTNANEIVRRSSTRDSTGTSSALTNDVRTSLATQALQTKLWNDAYDKLKETEQEVVERYEEILSKQLSANAAEYTHTENSSIEISQDREQRQAQMKTLVELGLKETEKTAGRLEKAEEGMHIITPLLGVISSAVANSPEASIAWVGVSFTMKLLTNPVTEATTQREGLQYVLAKMNWYWHLTDFLLERPQISAAEVQLRAHFEREICGLYGKLMLYQMKSLCRYSRHGAVVALRDILKLDDWTAQLDAIKACEKAIEYDSQQLNSQEQRLRMQSILDSSIQMQATLDGIKGLLQQQLTQQTMFKETKEYKACIRHLHITNPLRDKERIELRKGGLLPDVYRLTMDHDSFRHWNTDPNCRLLWIHGEPGKGKTMLVCGAIDELERTQSLITYFLCEAGNDKLNNATSVLRGLLFLLITKSPFLMRHLIAEYQVTGEAMFSNDNAWTVLASSFREIWDDPKLPETTIIIDALDECVTDRQRLLDFIASAPRTNVKWLVSSRPQPGIKERLLMRDSSRQTFMSLDLDAQSSTEAVERYIDHNVRHLARLKLYDDELREEVRKYLVDHAQNTFLWVALVCQELADDDVTDLDPPEVLASIPEGLDALYARMLKQVEESRQSGLCKRVLAITSVTYRPLALEELVHLDKLLEAKLVKVKTPNDMKSLRDILKRCGSFIESRNDVVSFIHDSARRYILERASTEVIPHGIQSEHRNLCLRSIDILSRTLKRNMYKLAYDSPPPSQKLVAEGPLRQAGYACTYWMLHLSVLFQHPGDVSEGAVEAAESLVEKHLLHWLEALSVLRETARGIDSLWDLSSKLKNISGHQAFSEFLYDAYRYAITHHVGIRDSPLQAYTGLLFNPKNNRLRQLFNYDEPTWTVRNFKQRQDWGACIHTLEGHAKKATVVAFSADGKFAASGSYCTIFLWNITNGSCQKELKGHSLDVSALAFHPNGRELLSGSCDYTACFWDLKSGVVTRSFSALDPFRYVPDMQSTWYDFLMPNAVAVAYGDAGARIASGSDSMVTIMKEDGLVWHRIEDPNGGINFMKLSPDARLLVTHHCNDSVLGKGLHVWDVESGLRKYTFAFQPGLYYLNFSPDGTRLATAAHGGAVSVWSTDTGNEPSQYAGHGSVNCLAISPDNARLAIATDKGNVLVLDMATAATLQTLEGHEVDDEEGLAFSPCGQQLVSSGPGTMLKIWDVRTASDQETEDAPQAQMLSFASTSNGPYLAAGLDSGTIQVFDTKSGACVQEVAAHENKVISMSFSPISWKVARNRDLLASVSTDGTVKVWEPLQNQWTWLATLYEKDSNREAKEPRVVRFRPIKELILVGYSDGSVEIINLAARSVVQVWQAHDQAVISMAVSSDGSQLATMAPKEARPGHGFLIFVWDLDLRLEPYVKKRISVLNVRTFHSAPVLAFNPSGLRLALHRGQGFVDIFQTSNCSDLVNLVTVDTHDHALTFYEHGEQCQYGIAPDLTWITKHKTRLLWLPPGFRPDKLEDSRMTRSSVWIWNKVKGLYSINLGRDDNPRENHEEDRVWI